MQFNSNSDWPGGVPSGDEASAAPQDGSPARAPPAFPTADIDPCARITTRVYNPARNAVATVRDVLVRTMLPPRRLSRMVAAAAAAAASAETKGAVDDNDDDDSFDSSSDEDDDSMEDADEGGGNDAPAGVASDEPQRAYWLQRTLRDAIYGRVKYAVVLRRKRVVLDAESGTTTVVADWEVTDEKCAIKEMSWQHIRRERDRLAEDPVKEVYAMQFLRKYNQERRKCLGLSFGDTETDSTAEVRSMMETHVMMPLDLLSDDRYLYSVMPFCNGGELFDRLDERSKFTEDECRYWMSQILVGLDNLQRAGVCHRDMSLENLLVHDNRVCLIIDLGMCLRIPYEDETEEAMEEGADDSNGMVSSFVQMNLDGEGNTQLLDPLDSRRRKRFLITPQGTCGKWHYMSPEIALNRAPFDAHAVDVWAAGVILFLMLTGFPPWERPCKTDERFKYMTGGYLVQMLTEWELGLSPDAMDLLQRMLWLDPRDRLSLEQVRAHPWMVNGRMEIP